MTFVAAKIRIKKKNYYLRAKICFLPRLPWCSNTTHYIMIIDIIIVALLILAIIIGIRQGLLTQICYLIAFIATSLIAPSVATPIGSAFTDSDILAFIIGFGIILIVSAILVWFISPLLKKILFWEVLRKINALLGAVVAVISTTLILSLICTTFNTLNLGDINTQKITDFATNCNDKEMVEQELDKVFKRDASMRDYFEPRFVAYETLDSSIFFGALVWLGDNVCPSLGTFNDEMAKNVKQYAANYVTQEMLNNDFAE